VGEQVRGSLIPNKYPIFVLNYINIGIDIDIGIGIGIIHSPLIEES
jgi:hypothetical protein